jgi:RNA polymerase sigma factor (sigma-70 family)
MEVQGCMADGHADVATRRVSSAADWGALYLAHRDAMYRVARRVLREGGVRRGLKEAVEDVVQSVMESLLKSPPPAVHNAEALLVRTTQRRAVDLLRSAHARHSSSESLNDQPDTAVPDFADVVTDSVTVKKLLQLLPERDREVVIRRYAWDESQKEVADDLGVSPSRVSQIGREGLRTLLHGLERRDEGDD